jgi:hypothetical protein
VIGTFAFHCGLHIAVVILVTHLGVVFCASKVVFAIVAKLLSVFLTPVLLVICSEDFIILLLHDRCLCHSKEFIVLH